MGTDGLTGGQYRPLRQKSIHNIHQTALSILEKTGIAYETRLDAQAEMLEKHGAIVDKHERRIRFPRSMVTEQVKKAPGRVVLYGRDRGNELDLRGDRVHFGTGGAAINVLDIDTGKARPSTLSDLYAIGRLADRLDNIDFFLRPCIPRDIPDEAYDVNVFYTCFRATTKHVMAGVNDVESLRQVREMAALLCGPQEQLLQNPFFSVITSFMISPLKLNAVTTSIMIEACKLGIPVALSSAPSAGLTSPVTLAGTLAQLHAEELAGITICQTAAPGARVLYGGIPGVADLRSMRYMGGAVEAGMMNAAVHQLSRFIGIPNYNSSGLTDSKIPDIQAGWEKALSTLLVAMGGSNYVHHAAGMLETMLTVAYEQYVLDDEIIGMCARVLRGINDDAEHLAADAITEVGPGGNFMLSPHTFRFMHSELFNRAGVSDRSIRDIWEREGASDAAARAKKIAKKLIEENKNCSIDKETDGRIRARFPIHLGDADDRGESCE